MKSKIKICFMGSPDFSVPSLLNLAKPHFEIKAVFTQEPKPANRGKRVFKQPVHTEAKKLNLPVFTPKNLKSNETYNYLKKLNLDFIIVVAYGHILPKSILDIPKYGCINLHASLLPRWRGAAPIHRAIMAGDEKTGISVMLMSEGLDEGDILSILDVEILEDDTISVLTTKLANLEKNNNYLVNRINRLKTNSLDLDFLDEKIRENTGFLDSDEIIIKFN